MMANHETPREAVKELLISGLTTLKQESLMYDIQLQVEETIFSAHRVVLAATSNYFKAMLGGNFKEAMESYESPIVLKGIPAPGFKVFLDFVYTGDPGLTSQNICDAILIANMYQVEPLIRSCLEFLKDDIDQEKFCSYLRIADEYNFQELLQLFEEYGCTHFLNKICKTQDFLELSLDKVTEYLKRPDLIIGGKEINVVNAARDWIQHDPDQRMRFTADMLKCVNLLNLSNEELMHVKNIMNIKMPDCQKMVDEALDYFNDPFSQPFYGGSLLNNRGSEGLMLVASQAYNNGVECKQLFDDIKNMMPEYADLCDNFDKCKDTPFWTGLPIEVDNNGQESDLIKARLGHLSKIDVALSSELDIAYVNIANFLFVFNRKRINADYTHEVNTLRYNASINKWISLKSPSELEPWDWICASECVQQSIMMISGYHEGPDVLEGPVVLEFKGTAHRYSVREDNWEYLGPTPYLDDNPALAYHSSSVYLFGGTKLYELNSYRTTESDPLWIEKAPWVREIDDESYYVSLVTVNDKLFAFSKDCYGEYDILNDQWTTIVDLNRGINLMKGPQAITWSWNSWFVHDGIFYMVSRDPHRYDAQDYIYRFNMAEREFSVCQKISPIIIHGTLTTVVRSPRWH